MANQFRDWAEEEDQILRKNYGTLTARQIMGMLGSRSRNAIVGRASRLGLTSKITGTYPRPRRTKATDGPPKPPRSPPSKLVANMGFGAPTVKFGRTAGTLGETGYFKQVELKDPKIDLAGLQCREITLMELNGHDCKWPLDNGRFCGLPQQAPYVRHRGRSVVKVRPVYCPAHHHFSISWDKS